MIQVEIVMISNCELINYRSLADALPHWFAPELGVEDGLDCEQRQTLSSEVAPSTFWSPKMLIIILESVVF